MRPNTRSTLPANRGFVVQLHAEAQLTQGDFRGRVEHVISARATHFGSLQELAAFMEHVLITQQQAEAAMEQEDQD